MRLIEGVRARLGLLLAPRAAEARMEQEMRFHIELEAERLEREEGLAAGEARRRALVAFGGEEKFREEMRDGRGLAWVRGLRLDLKLGARKLVKHPVLTLASVLALALAIALASAWFVFMGNMTNPRIPLPDSNRLVLVRNQDLATGSAEPKSLYDFEVWRTELGTLQDVSAASPMTYSVMTDEDRFATLMGARVTASLFRLVRVAPLLGRALTDEDMEAGAAPVVVIGHDVWQRLFDGDRAVLGRTLRLGGEPTTIVGVMPPGFGFPVNHELWTPLRETAWSHERRTGPSIMVTARLGRGASLKAARAEVAVIGERLAAAFPDTHAQIRPDVRRFGQGGDMALVAAAINIPFLLFLIVVSANIATLLFARTATREGELALRSALGASRRRLILQLVAEAFVLTSLAAALGLAAASVGLRHGMVLFWEVQQMRPPFWFNDGLSTGVVLYALLLALIGATIIGAIPGLRATRRQIRHRLEQRPGGTSLRFGRIATGVIVVQVAVSVAFIPVAIVQGRELLRARTAADFPADEFLSGRLVRQVEPRAEQRDAQSSPEATAARTAELLGVVYQRLGTLPGVRAATRTSRLPGFNHPAEAIEIEGDAVELRIARQMAVDPDFFEVMDVRITGGRAFGTADVASDAEVAIVDEHWATTVFEGRNPIGRRFRYPRRGGDEAERWYEIVGVATGLARMIGPGEPVALLHPLRPEAHAAVQFFLRTDGPPATLAPEVHALAIAVDPGIGVTELAPLDETWRPVLRANVFFTGVLAVVSTTILLFALIGIYALTSFTVAQRTREIGIRLALGASPGRIVAALFARAFAQIGIGILGGATLVSLTAARSPDGVRLVAGVALAVALVGIAGCAVPAARALRIRPADALRTE